MQLFDCVICVDCLGECFVALARCCWCFRAAVCFWDWCEIARVFWDH